MITEQDTKKRILATAFELFSTSSYDRVSVDDIAKKAGISRAACSIISAPSTIWVGRPYSGLRKTRWPHLSLSIPKKRDPKSR